MRICKVDANQAEIVKELRKLGCSVAPTHMVGKGFPDIIVGFHGVNHMFELKDGTKPPSARALTPDEVKWHAEWRGTVHVVNSLDEAIAIILK